MTSWCALLACLLSFNALAGSEGESDAPEFKFRDSKGAEHVVPARWFYFHIYTEPSKFARYSVRAVYDPKSHTLVKFSEMSSFTVKRGEDGYVATFKLPGEPGTRTLGFLESEKYLAERYVPSMLIKRPGHSTTKHEYYSLDEIAWPVEVKR